METLKNRIVKLLDILNERVYGKEEVMALALLSAVAGESIFLLGPPGVAKSMVARRLKLMFRGGTAFEYLMSRFSTPDEIFGPVSIARLKNEDTYERMTEGYLPTATVVFLDEIWKAGPAIQNALLTVINEKIFRNGQFSVRVPMKGLIAASNELPASGQGLEALYDRFLVRKLVGGIEDLSDFDRMISTADESEPEMDEHLAVSDEEYRQWQEQMKSVGLHYSVLEVIHSLKDKLEDYNRQLENADSPSDVALYVSDRRWKKIVRLLRAAAFLQGNTEVRLSDCLLMVHCLWNETSQIDWVRDAVLTAVGESVRGYVLNLSGIETDLQALKKELDSAGALRERADAGLQLVDTYYYQVERVRLAGRLLLFASDYQQLDDVGKQFYLHKDKYKTDCYVLKKYDPSMRNKVSPSKVYTLRRGRRSVFINDYEYPLLCTPDCTALPAMEVQAQEDIPARFSQLEQRLSHAEAHCGDWVKEEADYCANHLFVGKREKEAMSRILGEPSKALFRYRNELEEMKHAYRKENEEYPSERPEDSLFGATS